MNLEGIQIAVLVPCYNEEKTIEKVISDFQSNLPSCNIYVYDNNSSDRTAELASRAGAIVRKESRQGKGFVVRRMFADIEADAYVLIDGDDTYDASAAPGLLNVLLQNGLDMITVTRKDNDAHAYRFGHRLGNRMLTRLVQIFFGAGVTDMLSGYRILSRRFVKTFPTMSGGFDIETEMSVHALEIGIPMEEHAAPYGARPVGSQSKLKTYRDGLRILVRILRLVREERPLLTFGVLSIFFAVIGLALGIPLVLEFARTGLVPRFPTAILATGLMILAFLSLTAGLILDTVTHGRRENKRIAYLAYPVVIREL
ncbi:Glycosyltransferase involved in cell wall bisynthesis [Nitrosospira multiformis]|uniref:Glycosyltransferase involved in cell wall bisynthesis n=1 Tax=Nitrosospira multiformis TaxID=1231 RepID=A0A1H8G901_9PROT|nr:glycosyltransferase family 2 protein [Nitrosospira multiformis]SEN40224.1 Glycosyltransferase involved in cell wall bisynthesis [Nitrosospira multiformis]